MKGGRRAAIYARFLSIQATSAVDGKHSPGKEGDKGELSEIGDKHGAVKTENEISVGSLAMVCEG